jgi:hypothetical protein
MTERGGKTTTRVLRTLDDGSLRMTSNEPTHFSDRHIGSDAAAQEKMLAEIGSPASTS